MCEHAGKGVPLPRWPGGGDWRMEIGQCLGRYREALDHSKHPTELMLKAASSRLA